MPENDQDQNGHDHLKLFTVSDLAKRWRVGQSTIYDWVAQRKIPHIVLSKGYRKSTIRFRLEDIKKFEAENLR